MPTACLALCSQRIELLFFLLSTTSNYNNYSMSTDNHAFNLVFFFLFTHVECLLAASVVNQN